MGVQYRVLTGMGKKVFAETGKKVFGYRAEEDPHRDGERRSLGVGEKRVLSEMRARRSLGFGQKRVLTVIEEGLWV